MSYRWRCAPASQAEVAAKRHRRNGAETSQVTQTRDFSSSLRCSASVAKRNDIMQNLVTLYRGPFSAEKIANVVDD